MFIVLGDLISSLGERGGETVAVSLPDRFCSFLKWQVQETVERRLCALLSVAHSSATFQLLGCT